MDKRDVEYLVRDIDKEMPKHTDTTAKIPSSYSKLPKNLMDESTRVNNKFLNKHQGEIEEAHHKFKVDKRKFVAYQNKHYGDRDVLNHDGFFKGGFDEWGNISGTRYMFEQPFVTFSHPSINRVNKGADIETNDGSTGAANFGTTLSAQRVTGVIGTTYDRIAISLTTATGNCYLGSYTDSSDAPADLEATTGAISSPASYAWQSLTEWSLTTTVNWLATHSDTANGVDTDYVAGAADNRVYIVRSYQALPDPYGAGTDNINAAQMKIGHS